MEVALYRWLEFDLSKHFQDVQHDDYFVDPKTIEDDGQQGIEVWSRQELFIE